MTVAAHDSQRADDVTVVEMTSAQFEKAKKRALDSVGLTYAQLAKEAKRGQFSSPRARKVWMAVGDTSA